MRNASSSNIIHTLKYINISLQSFVSYNADFFSILDNYSWTNKKSQFRRNKKVGRGKK